MVQSAVSWLLPKLTPEIHLRQMSSSSAFLVLGGFGFRVDRPTQKKLGCSRQALLHWLQRSTHEVSLILNQQKPFPWTNPLEVKVSAGGSGGFPLFRAKRSRPFYASQDAKTKVWAQLAVAEGLELTPEAPGRFLRPWNGPVGGGGGRGSLRHRDLDQRYLLGQLHVYIYIYIYGTPPQSPGVERKHWYLRCFVTKTCICQYDCVRASLQGSASETEKTGEKY